MEERQRLKLTGTNSSIGLIVLIPYVHLTKSDDLLPSRQSASPTPPGRASQRLGRAVALADCRPTRGWHKYSFSITCVLPTWWLWRSGCTRSHSELGRETLQRQWYFVSRRGRVGRCQVCQTHVELLFMIKTAARCVACLLQNTLFQAEISCLTGCRVAAAANLFRTDSRGGAT